MSDEQTASIAEAPNRRRPLFLKPWQGTIPAGTKVVISERGYIVGAHAVDPGFALGGWNTTTIHAGRPSCLYGLITGRLAYEVTTAIVPKPVASDEP